MLRPMPMSAEEGSAVWVPDERAQGRSRLLAAMRRWGFEDFSALHAASVKDPEWFWRAVIDDLKVDFDEPFERVCDESQGKEFPRWFPGAKINLAHLCAHRHAVGELASKEAVVYEGDSGQRRALTFYQLDERVRWFAAHLARSGVRRGDRVVLFLPVVPEATVAFLACAMIGAIAVPAFTGYGPEAVATRLRDSGAVVLVTCDATTRRGNHVPMKAVADEALLDAPAIRRVIVVRHLDVEVPMVSGRDIYWDELEADPEPVPTVSTDANDPVTIIYTSGTTGAPKGIVHSHAGFAVKAATDFAYGFDVDDDDVIAWIADMGWMLGPLLIVGGLQLGATLVMTEGVPTYPTPERLWEIVARNGVTLQGIAPTAARAVMTAGGSRDIAAENPALRAFASTGESWDEATWFWLFDKVGGGRLPIINYSGGTETGGGILVSYPAMPMRPASFNGALLGMDVAVLDDKGDPVTETVGELAVRNTWPGMTHAFWGDSDRYLDTYWSTWRGVWKHGDLASVAADGTWRIHGRSDDTIKVSGRRVGPGELEAALLKDPRISDVAVIGVPDPSRGERIVAFVVPVDPEVEATDLVEQAVQNVGRSFNPTLHVVGALPKTKNGKTMRRLIRARHLGKDLGDLSALDPSTPIDGIPTDLQQGAPR